MKQVFAERYKTLSLVQLVEITNHPDQYTPDAFEAALAELQSRQVESTEIETAADAGQAIRLAIDQNRSPLLMLYDRINSSVFQRMIPRRLTITEKILRVLCILILLTSVPDLWRLIAHFPLMMDLIFSGNAGRVLLMLLQLGFNTLVPILLWKRAKSGWMMLCICLSIYLLYVLPSLLYHIITGDRPQDYLRFFTIFYGILYSAVLFYMNTKRMRALFRIRGNEQLFAFVIAGCLVIAGWLR